MGHSKTCPPVIQTANGAPFDLGAPRPESIDFEVIFHSLARLGRYTGHTLTPGPYSVAQHSVICSYLAPRAFAFEALVHDFAEAYVGDMALPMKMLVPGVRDIERRIQQAIHAALGLPVDLDWFSGPAVASADLTALALEKRDLLAEADWWQIELPDVTGLPPIVWQDTAEAEIALRDRFYQLQEARAAAESAAA